MTVKKKYLNLSLALAITFALASCGGTGDNSNMETDGTETMTEEEMMEEVEEFFNEEISGGDTDEHGCVGSAGYVWSELLQECVRLWEVGATLQNAIDSEEPFGTNVIRSETDPTVAEVFIPDVSGGVMMKLVDGVFQDEDGDFSVKDLGNDRYELYNSEGTLIFKTKENEVSE